MRVEKKPKISSFQFKIDQDNLIYHGESFDEQLSDIRSDLRSQNQNLDSTSRREDIIFSSHISNDARNLDSKDSKRNANTTLQLVAGKKYCEGIKTLRLYKGKAIPLDEFEIEEDEEEKEEENVSIFKNQDDEEEEDLNENTFNMSRKEINFYVSNQEKPKTIRFLQIIVNLVFFSILVLAYVDYFLNFNNDNVLDIYMTIYKDSYLKMSVFHHLLKSSNDLYFLNIGAFDSSLNITESSVKADMTSCLNEIKGYQLYLTQNYIYDSSALNDLMNNPSINIYFSENAAYEQFSLSEATQQMFSKIFNLINTNVENITLNNSNFLFVNLNLYGELFDSLIEANQIVFNDLLAELDVKQSSLISMLFSGTIIIAGCFLIIFILINLQKINEKTLALFLLIKERDFRMMYARNESFLSFLQTGDDEDEDFYENEEDISNKLLEVDHLEGHKIKKRKFKKTRSTPFKLIGALIIIGSILEFFFIFVYFSSLGMTQNLQPIMQFLKLANEAESQFFYLFNCHRTLLIQDQFLLQNTTLQGKCNQSVQDIYNFQSDFNDVKIISFI